MNTLIDCIKKIVEIVNNNGIVDFSTTFDNFKLSLSRKPYPTTEGGFSEKTVVEGGTPERADFCISKNKNVVEGVQIKKAVEVNTEDSVSFRFIKSPIVGTFYRSSSPESKPFVEENSEVKKGMTVCILEAMKVMNELKSDLDGNVVEFLVKDGSIVEYDQPIIKLKVA